MKRKLKVQVLDAGGDAALLVPRRHDNRDPLERSGGLEFKRSGAFLLIQTGMPAARARLA